MNVRNFIDRIKPTFEKGGKLGFLHSTFDAFETFMFVPNTVTRKGSHIRDCVDIKRVMIIMVLALVPAFLFGIWNTGYQHSVAYQMNWNFWQMVWYGVLKIVPLWMLAVATAFAVIFAKEVFGGTGMNIWNPALIARAFLFFSYPSKMSGDLVWIGGLSRGNEAWATTGGALVDGFSGATPLASASLEGLSSQGYSALNMFLGNIPGSVGETSVIAILIGAFILIFTGVASWKIMVSSVAGGLLIGWLGQIGGATDLPCWYQLIMGGFLFGSVFMATDPVTAAQTEAGKWIYGFLIGALAVIVRLFNPGYAEGMMLAILLMNTFAPLIDHCVIECSLKAKARKFKKIA